MPKKTLALIIVLAIVTIGLVVLALRSSTSEPNQAQTAPTEQPTVKTARLYFEPSQATVNTSSRVPSEIPIYIDTGNSEISGVQVELQYDPALFVDVLFNPASSSAFFDTLNAATILSNQGDRASGTVSYVVSIAPNTKPLKGIGQLGTLSFRADPVAQPTQTSIVFSPESAVTSLIAPDSILKETNSLQVTVSRTQPLTTPRASTQSGTLQ